MALSTESFVNVLSFFNRHELAQISVVSRLLSLIVKKYFLQAPLLPYESLAIRSAGRNNQEFNLFLEKSADHGGYGIELAYSKLSKLISPSYVVFNELHLTLRNPGDHKSWLPTLCANHHAFENTSIVVIKYFYDPEPEDFEELMNTLPVPSIQRLEIDYRQDLPVHPHPFFSYNIFKNCRSVNISTKSNLGLMINGQDIINWLHSNPSSEKPRRLYLSAYFTPFEMSILLGNLDQIFREAKLPCNYFLQLRGYKISGVIINKQKNEVTNEVWLAHCVGELQSMLVHRWN